MTSAPQRERKSQRSIRRDTRSGNRSRTDYEVHIVTSRGLFARPTCARFLKRQGTVQPADTDARLRENLLCRVLRLFKVSCGSICEIIKPDRN
jgi:hypothetical protein